MEKVEFKPPTKVTALWALYRACAIKEVAQEMGIQVETVAEAGKKYSDKTVPDNMEYLRLDPGEKSVELWQKVDTIAPPPTSDDIKSGKFPR